MSEELKPDVELEIVAEPVAVEPEPEAEPAPAPKVSIVPVPVDIEQVIAKLEAEAVKPAGPFVIGNAEVDTVKVSAIKFKNLSARRSISVYHTQRRLKELGYASAGSDREGFYAEGTLAAMKKFQEDSKIDGEGMPDLKTLKKLFKDDPNVKVED
jgi:peptidoglycan hydrolase-like protein with peptidoglycan-binding domain